MSFGFADIDECSNDSHVCDANATCTNTIGSHNCTCKEGFTGNGRSCSGTLIFDLPSKSKVKNNVYCTSFVLVDIDECSNGSHVCDVNANCSNTAGAHNCTCKEGFIGNGRSCSGIVNLVSYKEHLKLTSIDCRVSFT